MQKPNMIERFRRQTITRLSHIGLNNPRRTNYYFGFWKKHPELGWALLANLISRNTGWQMSDVIRASRLAPYGMKILGFSPAHYQALFVFLEMGNFLIFHDAFPQLEAYAWAKRYPEYSTELFETLAEKPYFSVDPFMILEWKRFFSKAQANNWFPNWWQEPDVQRHSFALIINEQNQIHDRLVNDPHHRYLGLFMSWVMEQIFLSATELGFTKLCFPVATSETNPTPDSVLIYTLNGFKEYDRRVQIGRDLYVGLFGEEQRRKLVIAWANAHPYLRGTRAEYNPHNFSVSPTNFFQAKKYSPPLVPWQGQPPAWPLDATKMLFYSHLHDLPVPLPVYVWERGYIIEKLLTPLSTPTRLIEPKPLSDLVEVTIGNMSVFPLTVLVQRTIRRLTLELR